MLIEDKELIRNLITLNNFYANISKQGKNSNLSFMLKRISDTLSFFILVQLRLFELYHEI